MKKSSKTTKTPPIVFHVRDEGEWSKNPSLNLVAFATIDPGIATIVEALSQSKTGQMSDNRTMMRQLEVLLGNGPDALFSFLLSNDLLLLGKSVMDAMKDKEVPHLCYHVVIFEEQKGLFVDGKSLVDQTLGLEEIKKTLRGSTTILFSYYVHLLHTEKAPPISSYFSVAGQENLCLGTMNDVKKLVLTDNYDEAARVIAKTLERLSNAHYVNTFTAYAVELMITGGTALGLKAAEEPDNFIPLLEKAERCFEVARVYSQQLKHTSFLASCNAHLAIIRAQLTELRDESEEEKQKQAVDSDLKKSPDYYRLKPDNAVCQNLSSSVKKNVLVFRSAMCHNPEEIFAEARRIFFSFQKNPNSVKIHELVCLQVLLDRLLAELPGEYHEMREQCHYALIKTHYSFAAITPHFESAMEHLKTAEHHLGSASLGGAQRSTDLLGASLYHMRGKVLLRFKKRKEEAVVALKKAYAIYQQHHNEGGIRAIICLVPSIADQYEPLDGEMCCAKK